MAATSCGETPLSPGESASAVATETQSTETDPAPKLKLRASLGWDENFPLVKLGYSAPIQVTISSGQEPVEAELIVSTPQITTGEGQRACVWSRPMSLPARSSKRFEAPIFVGPEQPSVLVELKEAGQTLLSTELSPIAVDSEATLVLVLGPRRGSHAAIQRHGQRQPLYPAEPRLPRDDASMAALDAILLDGPRLLPPTPTSIAALEAWIHGGGTLVVCCGSQGLPTSDPGILALLPAQPTGTAGSYNVRRWLARKGFSARIPEDGDGQAAAHTDQSGSRLGIVTAYPLNPSAPTATPLFVGLPVRSQQHSGNTGEPRTLGYTLRRGLGRVTLLGFSLHTDAALPLLTRLASVSQLVPRRRALALAPPEADPPIRTSIPAKGFNINAGQQRRHHALEAIRAPVMASTLFSIPSRTAILGFLSLYLVTVLGILTIGSRLIDHQEWLWLAVPVVAGSFIATTWQLTKKDGQDATALMHIEVLEVASGASSAASRSLVSIHSPLGNSHQVLLPPNLTAEPTAPPKVRGLTLPKLRLSPAHASVGSQQRVMNFSILANSTRTLRLVGPVTMDGFVSMTQRHPSQSLQAIQITNQTSESFSHGAILHGRNVREITKLDAGGELTVALTGEQDHLAQMVKKGEQVWRQATGNLSTDERRSIRSSLSRQLLANLVTQLNARRDEWTGPMAVLISEGSSSDLDIDGSPVVGLRLRAMVVHGSVERPPRMLKRPWALTRATSDIGCSLIEGKPFLTDGALIIDVEPPPELADYSISGILLTVDRPVPPTISLERLAPDGRWLRLELDTHRPNSTRLRWKASTAAPTHSINAAKLRLRGDGVKVSQVDLLLRQVNASQGSPK